MKFLIVNKMCTKKNSRSGYERHLGWDSYGLGVGVGVGVPEPGSPLPGGGGVGLSGGGGGIEPGGGPGLVGVVEPVLG